MPPRHARGIVMTSSAALCWYVYIAECADGTYYCGVTTDLLRRLDQHNGVLPGGAKYTRTRRPVKIIASRPCVDKNAACSLEYLVKSTPREKKLVVLSRHR